MSSSFLDWLGEEPDSGEQPIRSLSIYDSREGHDVSLTPDEIYENRTSRKKAWQKGYEPVTIQKTDPISNLCEIKPVLVGESQNGPYEIPEAYKLNMLFHFDDPESPNAGRDWFFFSRGFRTVLDPDAEYAKSDAKYRKQFCLMIASFLKLADYDMSQFTGETGDEETRALWDAFASIVDSFEGQQVWMNYQVGWYDIDKTGDWELSEKMVRVGDGS